MTSECGEGFWVQVVVVAAGLGSRLGQQTAQADGVELPEVPYCSVDPQHRDLFGELGEQGVVVRDVRGAVLQAVFCAGLCGGGQGRLAEVAALFDQDLDIDHGVPLCGDAKAPADKPGPCTA